MPEDVIKEGISRRVLISRPFKLVNPYHKVLNAKKKVKLQSSRTSQLVRTNYMMDSILVSFSASSLITLGQIPSSPTHLWAPKWVSRNSVVTAPSPTPRLLVHHTVWTCFPEHQRLSQGSLSCTDFTSTKAKQASSTSTFSTSVTYVHAPWTGAHVVSSLPLLLV